MKTNRRKFIANTSLAIIGLGMSNTIMGKTYQNLSFSNNVADIAQLLRQAAVKRKKGNLIEAKNIYNTIISINPLEIRAYDGYRKTLLQEKYKELEVLQLYLGGLTLYPDNSIFKERCAKEFMRLALGNKKFRDQLTISDDALEKAKYLLEQAKIDLPTNEQIEKQLEKANKKIQYLASIIDARQNENVKQEKKANHIVYKNRFSSMSIEEVKLKLDSLLEKAKDPFRDKNIRSVYKAYIYKLKENSKYDEAAEYSKKLFLFDKEDTHSLRVARKVCRKKQKYDELIFIERKNESIKNTFWAKIALFDSIYLKYSSEGVGSIAEMQNILTKAAPKRFTFYQKFEHQLRDVKLTIVQNNQTASINKLTTFAETLIGTESTHFIDKFNTLCAQFYEKSGDTEKALQVISIALKESNLVINDPFLQKLVLVNQYKKSEKVIHNERLLELRNKIANS